MVVGGSIKRIESILKVLRRVVWHDIPEEVYGIILAVVDGMGQKQNQNSSNSKNSVKNCYLISN